MQDRVYQRKRKLVEKFIKKHGKIDHSIILNNEDVDYDTLMKILSELRNEGPPKIMLTVSICD
jgi:biopolymer transport protein ExbD